MSTWQPSVIDQWTGYLELSISKDVLGSRHPSFTKNLGHNLQYLEYQHHVLANASFSHVTVYVLSVKTFVIYATSVVESIFYYVILAVGVWERTRWEEIKKDISSPGFFDSRRESEMAETVMVKPSKAKPRDIFFKEMIRIVRDNHLLDLDDEIFDAIEHLRTLRNQVHIHDVETWRDTDMSRFGGTGARQGEEWRRSVKVLYEVLSAMRPDKMHVGTGAGIAADGLLPELLNRLREQHPEPGGTIDE